MRARTLASLAVPAAFALIVSSCSSAVAPQTESPGSPSATTEGAGGGPSTATVPEVLDFEAPLLGGGTLRGADLAGKDVAFWFWAPW